MDEEQQKRLAEEMASEFAKMKGQGSNDPARSFEPKSPLSLTSLLDVIVSYVLEAITAPAIEHWPVYVTLAVVIFLAYLLHTTLDAKIEENLKLGMYGNDPEPQTYSKEDFEKELDQTGPYPRAMSALTSESLIKLRPLISKRAYGSFAKRKHELFKKRLQAYQE